MTAPRRGRAPHWPALIPPALIIACGGGREPSQPTPQAVQVDTVVVRDTLRIVDTVFTADTVLAPPPVRVCAGGDVLLGNNLDTTWALRAQRRLGRPVAPHPVPDSLLQPLRPLVRDAQVLLLNIEGAIGDGSAPRKCRPGSSACYAFRQPPGVAPALARLATGARLVANVANNHAMDAGASGFRSTVRHLEAAGILVTGADTLAAMVPQPTGDTLAFLGFATAQAGPDPRNLAAVERHVRRAAGPGRRVIVTMHMGAEGRGAQRTRDRRERFLGEDRGNAVAFARTAVDAGAEAVIGHGPHVLRAVEWIGDAFVAYSLGNLLTYGPFNLAEPLNRGAIVCLDLERRRGVEQARIRSTVQVPPGVVRPDPAGRAAWLLDSLSRLDFPGSAGAMTREVILRRPASRP